MQQSVTCVHSLTSTAIPLPACRTGDEIGEANSVSAAELRDPQTDAERVVDPKYLVVVGVCTHLGCVPIGGEAWDASPWGKGRTSVRIELGVVRQGMWMMSLKGHEVGGLYSLTWIM